MLTDEEHTKLREILAQVEAMMAELARMRRQIEAIITSRAADR